MDASNRNSNRTGSRTLEQILIDKVLDEAQTVQSDLAQALAVVLVQNGSKSDVYKYVEERLNRAGSHVENSNRVYHKLLNLIGETAVVGNLSNSEMKHRCSILIERLGVEEVMKLIHQVEAKRALPDNVVSFSKYKARKEKSRIFGSNQPKGA